MAPGEEFSTGVKVSKPISCSVPLGAQGCVAGDGNCLGVGIPTRGVNVQLEPGHVPLGTPNVLLWDMLALFL